MISQGDEGKGWSWCDGQSVPGECTSVRPAEAHTHSFCRYFEALVSVLSMTIELLFLQRRKPSTRVVELIISNGG